MIIINTATKLAYVLAEEDKIADPLPALCEIRYTTEDKLTALGYTTNVTWEEAKEWGWISLQ